MKRLGQLQLAIILMAAIALIGTPLVVLSNNEQEVVAEAMYLPVLDKGAIELEIAATTLTNYQFYDFNINYRDADELVFVNNGNDSEAAQAAIEQLQHNQPFYNAMLILGNEGIASGVHVSETEIAFNLNELTASEQAKFYFDPHQQMAADSSSANRIKGDWVLVLTQE